jgi:predicted glycoside hydrolase/deacetylase ChbG (UPF0249 family)
MDSASLDLPHCAQLPVWQTANPRTKEQRMDASRFLIVIADDFGIGPATSRAILELAKSGIITGTVLLANSPYAADAVRQLGRSGLALDVGWHPCLTMDPPAAGSKRVPSLVDDNGCLWPLREFLTRLLLGRIRPLEVEIELNAQYDRFVELLGRPPALVNSHQHVSLFPPVGRILRRVLARCRPLPYLRRVCEPWTMLKDIPGARLKRTVLNGLGRLEARRQARLGFPGSEVLAGITDPLWVKDAEFFVRWLGKVPGRVVELACHPGYRDDTLLGRDCHPGDGLIERRADELNLLRQPRLLQACGRAGLTLLSPSAFLAQTARGLSHAA